MAHSTTVVSDLKQIELTDEANGVITLYTEASEDSKTVTIPNDSEVTLLEAGELYSKVLYVDKDTGEEVNGFIKNEYLELTQSGDAEQTQGTENDVKETENNVIVDETPTVTEPTETIEEQKVGEKQLDAQTNEDNLKVEEQTITKVKDDKEEKTVYVTLFSSQPSLKGIALKNPTNVYSEPKSNADVLKSYVVGSMLKFNEHSPDWYICTVYINGKPRTGYIHKDDVETSEANQTDLRGVALNSMTNVYSKATTSSIPLKSYPKGSILKYKNFSPNWYVATVYVSGKRHTGYIHKNDVDTATLSPENLSAFALKNPTNVYANASSTSKVLKSYAIGKVLKYRSFTSEWFEATVYVNGKQLTGYIHKNDVGEKIEGPSPTVRGIALKNNTNVYEEMSKTSKVLKGYPEGRILKYTLYTKDWYKATVYINGKQHTGYIHVDDVEDINTNQKQVKGIAKLNKTPVYRLASKNSDVLKTYSQGSILKYRTLSPNWYEATVYVNGKRYTGYIHKEDVETSTTLQKSLQGLAKQHVNVYAKADRTSKVLKSYTKGRLLKVKTFTSEWFEASVIVNKKRYTGYIHKSDINTVLYNKVIVLDAGHGGHDGGASGYGIIEKHLNLDVTLALRDKLENAGAIVHLTRDADYFISLEDRAALSKKVGAHIFVSIHANAATPSAHGIETYYSERPYNGETNPYPIESKLLATYVQKHLVSETDMNSRGAKHGGYVVLRKNTVPSILVELGFMTNANDAAKMKQSDYKYKAAEGIYKGIMEYFD